MLEMQTFLQIFLQIAFVVSGGGLRGKPIRTWSHQPFVKML